MRPYRTAPKKMIFWSPSLGGIIRKRYFLEHRFTIDLAFSISTARGDPIHAHVKTAQSPAPSISKLRWSLCDSSMRFSSCSQHWMWGKGEWKRPALSIFPDHFSQGWTIFQGRLLWHASTAVPKFGRCSNKYDGAWCLLMNGDSTTVSYTRRYRVRTNANGRRRAIIIGSLLIDDDNWSSLIKD